MPPPMTHEKQATACIVSRHGASIGGNCPWEGSESTTHKLYWKMHPHSYTQRHSSVPGRSGAGPSAACSPGPLYTVHS